MRVPFIGNPITESAGGNSAQEFINVIPEIVKNPVSESVKMFLQRRESFVFDCVPNGVYHTSQEGRGIFYWNGWIFSVIGDELWRHQLDSERSLGSPVGILVDTLATNTGMVGFTAFTGASDYLFLCDGTDGYLINTSFVSTQIVDVDFPSPHIPMPVYMDGYIFLQKLTGEIYNCDAGIPSSWSTSSYLTPENYADGPVALARQNNMVVALGETSVEFFYNAGNPTPGSPLGAYDQAVLQFGCASPRKVAQEEGLLIFMARSDAGGRFITAVEGTKDTMISTESINKLLDREAYDVLALSTGYLTRMHGHLLYVLNLFNTTRTLVYDFESKYWLEFNMGYTYTEDPETNFEEFTGQYLFLPFYDAVDVENRIFVQDAQSGYIYEQVADGRCQDGRIDYTDWETSQALPDYYLPIQITATSYPFDAGTAKRKFCSKAELIGMVPTNGGDETFTISWSDDDGLTWSAERSILADSQEGRMRAHRCGSFRRRKWKFVHTPPSDINAGVSSGKFKLEAVELEIEEGTH